MKRLRIALLDDHAVVRHGLVARLGAEPDIDVVGAYSTSRELIAGLLAAPADVILLDYALGPDELDGVSLIRALRAKFPDCPILVLSTHHEPATVALALRVGARGFAGKGEEMAELVKALRKVVSGAVYLSAEMSYRVAEASTTFDAREGEDGADALLLGAALSAREREVIRCYLAGMTVTEIAEKFKRSIKTISSQKTTAFRKLGVTSNNELFKIRHTIGEA
ncbi:response regulator transcription factor [Janthinobacterium sp. TB1-E2]|uniref:Response regulator transcription factor n=2 Tax=Janthinobacterium TaxID=29580 RepID=A0ABZ2GTN0_9BURK|nr:MULTISPECIES: response regulator transcription factor [Janthinobacterium]MDX8124779.1 response regulator transcription factor [Janthinobacterium sp. GMG2]PHV31060.1 DNA-binding response regulator [Janthinobacterium sp. BJB312]WFR82267.1 response regulator transcription factor [Janthinobacterium rivuli]